MSTRPLRLASILCLIALPLLNAGMVAVAPAQAATENLLTNSSFEEGAFTPTGSPTGWAYSAFTTATAHFTWDDTQAHTGTKSVRISADTANDARWGQTVAVVPHSNYLLSGWIKTENIAHTDDLTDSGANLSVSVPFIGSQGIYGTNDWTFVSYFFNSANETQLTIMARLGNFAGVTTGTAWYDDLTLAPVELVADPESLLANGSFEEGGFFAPLASPYGWQTNAKATPLFWDDSVAHSGGRSVKIVASTASDTAWMQTVAVEPDTYYLLSGWIKTENVAHTVQSVDAGANLSLMDSFTRSPALFATQDWTYPRWSSIQATRVASPSAHGSVMPLALPRAQPGLTT